MYRRWQSPAEVPLFRFIDPKAACPLTAQNLPWHLIKDDGRLGFPSKQTVPNGTLANGVRRQRLFPGKSDFCGVWDWRASPKALRMIVAHPFLGAS